MDRVTRILKEERDLVIGSRPLEATSFETEAKDKTVPISTPKP